MELSAAEGRVLGCLIEQEAAAPGSVPLTLNALRLACNQPTGRDPVVAYDDRTVEDTLLSLKSRGLARFVPPSTEARDTRYRHRADQRWRMGPVDLAVLAVLLLRGVQTVREVRAQVQRLHPLVEPGEVDAVLDALAARTPSPFAARVERRPGEQEIRWVEVLTPRPPDGATADAGAGGGLVPSGLGPSYAELVARVAELERRLSAALERPAAAEMPAAPPPPPPPPVDVRARPVPQLAFPDDRRYDPGSRRPGDGRPRPLPAATLAELAELVDRVVDIERRLARIEAELGALR
jgi:uncharacterized protein YceH (UPF0502 family)